MTWATFTFPRGVVEIDTERVERYPREYAPLAYLLEVSGFPVQKTFATKGSELERTMKEEGQAWLLGYGLEVCYAHTRLRKLIQEF